MPLRPRRRCQRRPAPLATGASCTPSVPRPLGRAGSPPSRLYRPPSPAAAAAAGGRRPPVEAVLGGARRVAVIERVNDHENLGILFRSAAALGVDAVLLDPECSDPLYRRCVRVSIGHVLGIPWTR